MIKKKEILFYLGTKLTWLLILFLGKVGRISLKNRHHWDALVKSGKGFLIPVWHGKMLLPIYVHRNLNAYAMVSEHRDGEMMAQTIHRLGFQTIRGSSTRGGRRAFIEMLHVLKKNNICAIMPDGPKGPRHQFKVGILLMAIRANVPLMPITFAASKPITLKSWDRFTLWWPGSRLCVIYGKPFTVPTNLSPDEMELYRRQIESYMISLEQKADAFFRD